MRLTDLLLPPGRFSVINHHLKGVQSADIFTKRCIAEVVSSSSNFPAFLLVSDADTLSRLRNALAHNFTLLSVNIPEMDEMIASNKKRLKKSCRH